MPIHPAPPTDLPGLVAAFTHALQQVVDLGRHLTDEQLALPTDCPGWTVKDQISHLAAEESSLEGLPQPEVEVPDYDHVRNDLGRAIEPGVEARRGRSGADIVRELDYVLGRRVAALGSPGLEIDSIVPGLGDRPMPVGELLRMRCLDAWVHEQDIRTALDKPGDQDGAGASIFVATALRQVPQAIARRAEVPLGDTVIIELTGPVTARIGVRVDPAPEDADDDRPVGTVLFGGDDAATGGSGHTTTTMRAIDPDTQITTIKLSTSAFERLAAGRKTVDEVTFTVAGGDEQVARRVLASLSFLP